jgi:hypothetical protein
MIISTLVSRYLEDPAMDAEGRRPSPGWELSSGRMCILYTCEAVRHLKGIRNGSMMFYASKIK